MLRAVTKELEHDFGIAHTTIQVEVGGCLTRYMKILVLIVIITAAPAFAQNESIPIRSIDFYGADGLKVDVLRAALPLHEGDQLSLESKDKVVGQLKEAIKRVTGREPSDVASVCCDDRGRMMMYIGLGGGSVDQALYNTLPRGSARLPQTAIKVHREAERAWLSAIEKGVSGEDDSQGFALSTDQKTRTKQLALHRYVVRHTAIVRRVLASAGDVEQRRIAAEMLGYAGPSREQIHALIHAGHDVDDGVRNNAIRALGVFARSSPEASAMIPGECFVGLLNSGLWTDLNKTAELLSVLTERRDPRLLVCLREQALASLVEMARWSNPGHADSARLMLGRIAGIDEKSLFGMLERQEVEPIINALGNDKNTKSSLSCPVCAARK